MSQVQLPSVFGELDGQRFPTYQQLQEAILAAFNRHLAEFPPGYSYLQLIEWGARQNWIVPTDGNGFRIAITAKREAMT